MIFAKASILARIQGFFGPPSSLSDDSSSSSSASPEPVWNKHIVLLQDPEAQWDQRTLDQRKTHHIKKPSTDSSSSSSSWTSSANTYVFQPGALVAALLAPVNTEPKKTKVVPLGPRSSLRSIEGAGPPVESQDDYNDDARTIHDDDATEIFSVEQEPPKPLHVGFAANIVNDALDASPTQPDALHPETRALPARMAPPGLSYPTSGAQTAIADGYPPRMLPQHTRVTANQVRTFVARNVGAIGDGRPGLRVPAPVPLPPVLTQAPALASPQHQSPPGVGVIGEGRPLARPRMYAPTPVRPIGLLFLDSQDADADTDRSEDEGGDPQVFTTLLRIKTDVLPSATLSLPWVSYHAQAETKRNRTEAWVREQPGIRATAMERFAAPAQHMAVSSTHTDMFEPLEAVRRDEDEDNETRSVYFNGGPEDQDDEVILYPRAPRGRGEAGDGVVSKAGYAMFLEERRALSPPPPQFHACRRRCNNAGLFSDFPVCEVSRAMGAH
ncbi:hypothetical protein H0H81_009256 [Sphagnurus paluster]|uniref:Uncharacterized protein n=1 Tax=Sphagnurus paluster TaxID=117069 RepID=A0A9P7GJL8_9AGAR|nr:hypothetical protein H0H81_009256 [Sphagnurus paluster]